MFPVWLPNFIRLAGLISKATATARCGQRPDGAHYLRKLATVQLLDVAVPTTDGRELLLVRRTEPGQDVQLVLDQLGLTLPPQPPPRLRVPPPM